MVSLDPILNRSPIKLVLAYFACDLLPSPAVYFSRNFMKGVSTPVNNIHPADRLNPIIKQMPSGALVSIFSCAKGPTSNLNRGLWIK